MRCRCNYIKFNQVFCSIFQQRSTTSSGGDSPASGLVIGPDVVKEEEGRAALGAQSKKSTSLKKRTSLDAEKPPKPGSVGDAEAEASTVAESLARSTASKSRISSVSYTFLCKHTMILLYYDDFCDCEIELPAVQCWYFGSVFLYSTL